MAQFVSALPACSGLISVGSNAIPESVFEIVNQFTIIIISVDSSRVCRFTIQQNHKGVFNSKPKALEEGGGL